MNVVAIIQARMGSSRLPGKVMMDLAGAPMLARVTARVQRASTLNDVAIATTTAPQDDVIERWAKRHGWPLFRGSEEDVLDRYYQAAKAFNAEIIVRVTADCPLIDPVVIDAVVQELLERQPEIEYASNVFPRRTYPRGLDVEAFRFDTLERIWREDLNPAWREHVTPYIHRNSKIFRTYNLCYPKDLSHFRWTVDTMEDYILAYFIYDTLQHDEFSWQEVLELLKERPEWVNINKHVLQKLVP